MRDKPCFRPGQLWMDDRGVAINAHGGGILRHEGRYYWFGEHKVAGRIGNTAQVGVHCYVSDNLCDWQDAGISLSVTEHPASEIRRGCVIERPKVVRNRRTGRFVMWFHLEEPDGHYQAARCGVAVSDAPAGPYVFLHSMRPNAGHWPLNVRPEQQRADTIAAAAARGETLSNGNNPVTPTVNVLGRDFVAGQHSRDMTLFEDDDGAVYHVYSSEHNSTLHIARLGEDLLAHDGVYVRAFENRWMEAPALFKARGRYYLLASDCTGWDPNAARCAVAPHPLGPWTELDNPCRGVNPANGLGPEKTFGGQSTFVLGLPDREDAFIAMFDIWRPENAIDGRYVWLPIAFEGDQPVIAWRDAWDLDVFGL